MARRKTQAKSSGRKLVSDQRLTIDKSGRVRIGGKFASSAKVAAWKAARTRRGLPKTVNRMSPTDGSRRRSQQAKKAAATRRLQRMGAEFIGRRRTPRANFLKIDYRLGEADEGTIRAVMDRVFMEDVAGGRVVMNATVQAETNEGEFITFGTPFQDAKEDGAALTMSESISLLVERYVVAAVREIILTFSFERGFGG
jgi:hypothetical protein